MLHMITMKQASEEQKQREFTDNVKAFNKARRIADAALGGGTGLIYETINHLNRPNLFRMICRTTLCAAAVVSIDELYGMATAQKAYEPLVKDVSDFRAKITSEILTVSGNYNAIFSAYMDDYVVEDSLYRNWYRSLQIKLDIETLEQKEKGLASEATGLKASIDTLTLQLTELARKEAEKEAEDKAQQGVIDLPAYKPSTTSMPSEKSMLASTLNAYKESLRVIDQAIKDAVIQKANLEKEMKAVEANLDALPDRLVNALANRNSRKLYVQMFIDPLKAMDKDLETFGQMEPRHDHIRYVAFRLAALKHRLSDLELAYENFIKTLDARANQQQSTLARIKTKGRSKDMTYANAPYWKIFEIYTDPKQIKQSESFSRRLQEIIDGAEGDFLAGREEGSWLEKRNFGKVWQFTLGEFNEDDATRLSELLDVAINLDTPLETINSAYKSFVKSHHSDIADGTGDLLVAECSTLVKRIRAYHLNREALMKEKTEESEGNRQ